MSTIKCIGISLISIIITGCVHTSFCLINKSGQRVSVLSGHTKIVSKIDINESKDIDHTIGDLTITTSDGKNWYYNNISVPDMNQSKYLERGKYFIFSTLKLYLLLNQEGMIYVLPKSQKHIENQPLSQPKGYPLVPTNMP